MPTPWFDFLGNFKSYPQPTKKDTTIHFQAQEAAIELNETFGVEESEQRETVELIVLPIIEKVEK